MSDDSARQATDETTELGELKEPSSAQRLFLNATLWSEVFVVLFATLVAHGLEVADLTWVWAVGAALMFLAIVAARLLRVGAGRSAGLPGIILGSVVQALLIGSGVFVPAMFAIGAIFAVLWVVSLRLGARIDVERWERYETALAAQPEHEGPGEASTDQT